MIIIYINSVLSYSNAWQEINTKYSETFCELETIIREVLTVERIRETKERFGNEIPNSMTVMQIDECFEDILRRNDWMDRIPMGRRRFIGHVKDMISVDIIFRRGILDSYLISNFPIGIRNQLIEIPVLLALNEDFMDRHLLRRPMYYSFEKIRDDLLSISPLTINFPFLVLGISDHETPFDLLEISGMFDGPTNVEIIDRSIEFPPAYYQAGLGILAYFNKILKDKYPNTPAKIKILQEDMIVKMIIETESGNKEIIEQALEEYQQVIKGEIKPEEYLHSQAQILELKTELRIMNVRLETQAEIISFQKNQINVLSDIISKGLQSQPVQPSLSINVSPTINIDNKLSQKQIFDNNFDEIVNVLREISAGLKNGNLEATEVEKIERDLEESDTEQKKIGVLHKIKNFIDVSKNINAGIGKSINLLNDGSDLINSLSTHYNSLASLCGLPTI